jgi:hypothetical protein
LSGDCIQIIDALILRVSPVRIIAILISYDNQLGSIATKKR